MSLDASSTASIGAIATPVAMIINPALGLAVGAGFSLATSELAAGEQRELTARNIQIQKTVQRANELRQVRTQRQARGRFMQRIASSGFTTRGTPIEQLADFVAEQELDIQTARFNTRLTIQDLTIRGEHRARQTEAAGRAEASKTLLTGIASSDLLE